MTNLRQLRRRGMLLLISFFIVLVLMFIPLFPGLDGKEKNGLDYLDNFFNQLSKGSAYYIDDQLAEAATYTEVDYSARLTMKSEKQASRLASMLTVDKINASAEGGTLLLNGDLGRIMTIILEDADSMYYNDSGKLKEKYNIEGQRALYSWYQMLKVMEKDLNRKKAFDQAKFVKIAMGKAVEPAYNYYMVEAKPVKEEVFLLIFSLVFYVFYTMWYGYGLLYIFEGIGIRLSH